MKIVKLSENESILRQKCSKITKFDKRLNNTINNMIKTMLFNEGFGIAAPQVGLNIRLFVALVDKKLKVFINPEIISMSEETNLNHEGCLSIQDTDGLVPRSNSITIRYFDGKKFQRETYNDFDARVIQHEFDHIEGILYIDKAIEIKKVI